MPRMPSQTYSTPLPHKRKHVSIPTYCSANLVLVTTRKFSGLANGAISSIVLKVWNSLVILKALGDELMA